MSCRWLELVQFGHTGRNGQLQDAIFQQQANGGYLLRIVDSFDRVEVPATGSSLAVFAAEVGRGRDKNTVLSFVEDKVGLS